ncbi:MAG: NADH-quinone oxidoreductase subunit H [Fibromonadaceae bacterium]|jgi:NADH-quinone oxidoreductase subunit H|nr:NADH-quinone oxidoreductase subunit H [Fibromonadaceae bacterium]
MTFGVPNFIGDMVREYSPWPELALVVNVILAVVAVLAVGIGSAPILIYMERKVCAHVQCRLGPMRLGWHGILQTIADVAKLLFKEVFSPKGVDTIIYYMAPMISLTVPFFVLALIPFGKQWQVIDLSFAVPTIIAINGLGLFAILLGGWASNNKYSLLSALRSGAQMISYEVSFAMILLFVVMISGSASLNGIVEAQNGTILDWWIFKLPVLGFIGFLMYMCISTAELNRAPFDIAEAEQELTAGFHTEYTGTAFAMFYLTEYINMISAAALGAIFFLGGWQAPLIGIESVDSILLAIPDLVWMFAKIYFLIWLYMIFRWTWLRPRIDQLMNFEWKFLLPLSLIMLLLGAIFTAMGWVLK